MRRMKISFRTTVNGIAVSERDQPLEKENGGVMKRSFSWMMILCASLGLLMFLSVACRSAENKSTEGGAGAAKIQIGSPAFPQRGTIPDKYTCRGENVSPPLEWSGIPQGAKSLALTVEDPDAPGRTFVHWVLFNVPPTSHSIAEGVSRDAFLDGGSMQGTNDFGRSGYDGPCPPPGKAHRYFFRLFALDMQLSERPGAREKAIVDAMQGHVLAAGELVGTYRR